MSTELDPEVTPIEDFGSVLDDWIAGASLTRIPVTIYGKQHLFEEYQRLTEEREIVAASEEEVEQSVGEISRLTEIDERLAEIHDEWMASKSVWIVEDISEQLGVIRESVGPIPEQPVKPELLRGASDAQKRSHTIAMQKYDAAVSEYEKAAERWNEEFSITSAAAAVVRVEFANGHVQDGVTVDQVRALAKKLGEKQVNRIQAAIRDAMLREPVIDAPFSHASSHDDQISS